MSGEGKPPEEQRAGVRAISRFFKLFSLLLWALVIAVTVIALVTGSWWAALLGVVMIAWRVGVRRLVRANESEIKRRQSR